MRYLKFLEAVPVVKAETMEEAVGSAYSQSQEGDPAILSPDVLHLTGTGITRSR